MAELTGKNIYLKFIGQCTECGHCREACSSLSCAGMNLGQIAKRMLELQRQAGEDADPAALAAAMSAALAASTSSQQVSRARAMASSA